MQPTVIKTTIINFLLHNPKNVVFIINFPREGYIIGLLRTKIFLQEVKHQQRILG